MSRFCSDLTRHMRLFELLRQQNLAAEQAVTRARLHAFPSPDQMNSFVSEALRSLDH